MDDFFQNGGWFTCQWFNFSRSLFQSIKEGKKWKRKKRGKKLLVNEFVNPSKKKKKSSISVDVLTIINERRRVSRVLRFTYWSSLLPIWDLLPNKAKIKATFFLFIYRNANVNEHDADETRCRKNISDHFRATTTSETSNQVRSHNRFRSYLLKIPFLLRCSHFSLVFFFSSNLGRIKKSETEEKERGKGKGEDARSNKIFVIRLKWFFSLSVVIS